MQWVKAEGRAREGKRCFWVPVVLIQPIWNPVSQALATESPGPGQLLGDSANVWHPKGSLEEAVYGAQMSPLHVHAHRSGRLRPLPLGHRPGSSARAAPAGAGRTDLGPRAVWGVARIQQAQTRRKRQAGHVCGGQRKDKATRAHPVSRD